MASLDLKNVDKIVVSEAMGIHIGDCANSCDRHSLRCHQKTEYRLPGEVVIGQETGYFERNPLYESVCIKATES